LLPWTKSKKTKKHKRDIPSGKIHKNKIHYRIAWEDTVPIGADSSGIGADSSGIPLQGVELNRILSGPVQSPPGDRR